MEKTWRVLQTPQVHAAVFVNIRELLTARCLAARQACARGMAGTRRCR